MLSKTKMKISKAMTAFPVVSIVLADMKHVNFLISNNSQHDDKNDYENSGTKDFNKMTFKYLCIVFFPLTVCYSIYSVIYSQHGQQIQHKNWYGLVTHPPWKMITYK